MGSLDQESAVFDRANGMMRPGNYQHVIAYLAPHAGIVESSFRLSWTLGWAHFKLEEYDAAAMRLKCAVGLEPERPEGHLALGLTYRKLKQFQNAEISFMDTLRLQDMTEARQGLAVVLVKMGRPSEAEEVFREGLRKRPQEGERWAGYGDFLADHGREKEAAMAYNAAEQCYREGLKIDPDSPRLWTWYGDFLSGLERKDEAAMAYAEAERLRKSSSE
jgi:tetratricopeptide (TPR) repeat protein